MKWLHLSDLHIIKKVNWEVFIKDLLQRCEERGKIDLVIVTGDFHEFKEKDDFSKAKIFLIDLIEKLKLDITKDLFLIPGDHDGSNPICDHKDGNIAVLKKDVTRINGKEWNELLEQFESYENFVKELIPKYPFEHPAGEHCRTWNDKITFIHCNSAVVSDLIDEKEQLLNIDTFANLAMESRLPSIVLMHNHISDIHKEQVGQIKGIIRNSKIKAFFCGAHHKQQMDMINVSDKQNCQIPCVGCYKSAPDAEDRYSTCGVIIGTWINEKATLEGWTWKVDRSFKLDNIISGQTIEMGEKYYNEASKYVEGKVLLRNHKFSNDKKLDYVKKWNDRMFLHLHNKDNQVTIAKAFIMPECRWLNRDFDILNGNTFDIAVQSFLNYDRTATFLVVGVPGIGKTTITAWLANKYKDDENVHILRFRDWESDELKYGLLRAITNTLNIRRKDLENLILILDGLDEMKTLNIRNDLMLDFLDEIRDLENFKCIITSRTAYIDPKMFHASCELEKFDINKINQFSKKVIGKEIEEKNKIIVNLDVLGIPVILYLALMANIDIGKNPTKPELYYRIFAEKGGIFDKFYKKGIEYDSGRQILRNSKNIKNYLNVLRDIAFKMFEKKSLILSVEECTIPKLEFESNKVNILEFPIKYLFENSETKIEFIHRSIYEFFVANKLLESFQSADKISKYELANVFGKNLSKNVLSKEILEFMNYKINELISFENIEETFQLMLDYGMTYFTKSKTKNILESEQIIFANMLEIIHIYGKSDFDFRNLVIYIKCNKNMALNLEEIRMQDEDLRGANFQDSNLMNAKINYSDLRGINGRNVYAPKIELNGTDLRGADLKNAKLQCAKLYNAKLQVTDFSGANLEGAHLEYANLRGAKLKGAILKGANLEGANLEGINLEGVDISVAKIGETIFDEEQIEILKKDIELLHWKVLVHTTNGLVNYEEYFNASVYPQVSQCH